MPQVFQVLRCYKCFAFQVHQVKKSNKWECKLCGEKQSIKRQYGTGSGKDCRVHVQKLNELRGETAMLNLSHVDSSDSIENTENIMNNIEQETTSKSKWSNYIEDTIATNTSPVDEVKETLFGKEVVLEIFKKRKKEFRKNMRKKFIAYKKNSYQQASDEDDVSNPVEVTGFHDTTPPQRKTIKKFVPPTTQLKLRWTEYNEPDYSKNHTDKISNSELSIINNKNEPIRGNLCTNNYNKTYNHIETDRITLSVSNQKVIKKDENMNMNFHTKSVAETHKQTSKWTEFIDNTEFSQDFSENASQDFEYFSQKDTATVKQTNLFSLCDDNDLDSVLDI
ncbi:MRN complex-interacting protein isoform X1 [Manduca sexta]|uniref:MRN complex-interacting protein isoform X1 n=2 Tax=Manduca sexta TaxID=7130 RepID=UPI00188E787F|nr:MRN complex-interacting protein isoform X1 [Manduca sexta]XP_037300692.1 MRN complex-interacting protein isoform X1 [Manduca sexta]XP_037300693.1 MRN complex-interacting protein isoform X1 [Manduca sexta]